MSAAMRVMSFAATVRLLVQQAWPILIAQWAGMAFGVMDTAMTGHASATDLAAMALAGSIYVTIFVGLMGVVHALIPIMAQHFGAGRMREAGLAWSQGIWLALGLALAGGVCLLFPGPWLSLSGDVDPDVRQRIEGYLLALVFALPAALMFRTVHALCTAVSRPKVIMSINLVAVCLKAFFNWVLIYGKLGIPAMGAVGAGVSTALVFWISLALGILVIRRDAYYAPLQLGLRRPHWPTLRELLRLGLPMGGSYLIEVIAFTFMALMIARGGILVTGAHQIMANLVALCYMAPMAVGIAASAQTAQALGAGDHGLARRMGRAGMLLAVGAALLNVAIVLAGRGPIAAAYTSDTQVALLAVSLFALLPWFHVADASQTLTVSLLRAYKIAFLPMLVQMVALGGIGLIGGWYFAFGPGAGMLAPVLALLAPQAPPGAATLWAMATVGMLLSLILLQPVYWRVVRRTADQGMLVPQDMPARPEG